VRATHEVGAALGQRVRITRRAERSITCGGRPRLSLLIVAAVPPGVRIADLTTGEEGRDGREDDGDAHASM
jgi:hypothetical protein